MKNIFKPLFLIFAVIALVSCSSGGEDVPAGMKLASGDYLDYRFYVPEKWIVETSTGVTTAKYSDSILANVSVMAMTLDKDIATPEDYWNSFNEYFLNNISEWNLESSEDSVLSGYAAKKYVYTGSFGGVSAKYMQVICIRSGAVYIFTYTADPEKYEEYLSDVEKMLENFTFNE